MSNSIHTVELQRLVDRIRAGDLRARDELLRGVCGRLESLSQRMKAGFPRLKRWTETDDVLQGALVRLMRALESVEITSTRAFFGLAATQIRRELLDMVRHFEGPQNDAANLESGVKDAVLNNAKYEPSGMDLSEWAIFHQSVEELPAEEREVVSLVYYHGWTQSQVAELFQVNVRTVRRWWNSALAKLSQVTRQRLKQD